MRKLMEEKRELLWKVMIFLLLAVYLAMFAYLNLVKYTQHVDSDIAAEALLAREMWTDRSITPDNWISSTERRIFGMPTVAALLYGVTGSMTISAGAACVLTGGLLIAVLYWFLRKIGLSQAAVLTAILVLCAVPVNGLRNDGQMVPFVMLLLFLFADYYAFHSILMFLTIAFYFHLKKGNAGKKEAAAAFILFVFTLALSLGGQRCLQMVILPMVVVEIISLFQNSNGFSEKLPQNRYYATGYVATMILAFLISSLYGGKGNYAMLLLSPREIMEKLFLTVPAAILEGFGIAGNAGLESLASLMQLMIWAFLALIVYGLFYIFSKKNEVREEQKNTIVILAVSVGITAFIVCITSAEAAHNYFVFSWFISIIVIGVLIDCFRKKKSWFADIILFAVCVFAVLNIKYTYAEAVTVTDHLKEYEEVADFLIEKEISYGYAEFWDAARISLVRDGAVTMGNMNVDEGVEMYWWLTSVKWYPPNLPVDMETAYVIKKGKEDAFLKQFSSEDKMEQEYENALFSVFVSDKNYLKAW